MAFIGIDLGSSNSCAAVAIGSTVKMIELNASGALTMPSVVCIKDTTALIGADAVEAGKTTPDYDFRNWKRHIGERFHPDEDLGSQITAGADGMIAYRGPGGHLYSPTELSSFLLTDIIGAANEYLEPMGDKVTGAVIGVPAPFTPDQIEQVKKAANMAGLETVYTIEEPVAAAIAHNVDARKTRTSIVVDFGGGTLDVSILRSGEGHIRVLAKNGIGDLGGADWDKRAADYVINLFRAESRSTDGEQASEIVLRDNAMVKVLVEAEASKKRLTDVEETTFRLENISRSPKAGTSLHMIYPIDRRVLNELTRDLQERVLSAIKAAIEDAKRQDPKFSVRDLTGGLFLVGGMTRVPAVRQIISEFLGMQPKRDENPEQVVAMGCAIKAAILEGRRPDVSVSDITSHDVAIETVGNVPAIVIPKGTTFPVERTVTLSNADDDQSELSLRLLYVTRARAEDCHVIEAQDIPIEPSPAETLRIKVTLAVNDEGQPHIVEVAA